MSGRARVIVPALLAVLVVITGALLGGGLRLDGDPAATQAAAASGTSAASSGPNPESAAPVTPEPTPTPRPALGATELYGYIPYWHMTDSMASYFKSSPVSTVLLFSVTQRKNGSLNTSATGYRRITGAIGRRLIDDAHRRDARVELVFTSFGADKNARFFGRELPPASSSPGASGSTPGATTPAATPAPTVLGPATSAGAPSPTAGPPPWRRTINELVDLAVELGVDGINVDVELLDALDRPAYGDFLAALGSALRDALPKARLTVATEAGPRGVGNAGMAASAGVDRVFLMGYDYHWSGSQPGSSSPIDRLDGTYTLRWSIDAYVAAGVPRERILLGLPLYGMQWRTEGFDRSTAVIGNGVVWIPNRHTDVVLAPNFAPFRDEVEHTEYFVTPDDPGYVHTYYDSPGTLRLKLALALDNGLGGAGFWAIGYERGLPGYVDLMRDFRDGKVEREESPDRP